MADDSRSEAGRRNPPVGLARRKMTFGTCCDGGRRGRLVLWSSPQLCPGRSRSGRSGPAELARFYARLSAESRYARFHAVSNGIGAKAVDLLCGPDHEHREGFVAEAIDGDQGGLAIVGHLCLEPGKSALEMAIAVADDWHRRGVGRSLLSAAIKWAADHGIARLEASTFSTNSAILGLVASLGCPTHTSSPSAGVVVVTIDVEGTLPKAA